MRKSCKVIKKLQSVRIHPPPPFRVWLKSPPTHPTPPTIISSPYKLNKQIEQSSEFIGIKWMFTNFWTLFGWFSRLGNQEWIPSDPLPAAWSFAGSHTSGCQKWPSCWQNISTDDMQQQENRWYSVWFLT